MTTPPESGDTMAGRLVAGRYEIVRSIGDGGMAEVYLARQLQPARRVALKRLRPGMAASPDVAARFLREAEIAGTLSHPNLITVHEYLVDEGTPFIAMEYMEHGSVRAWVGRLTTAQAGLVLDGVLAALDHAAAHGVVHRDLKPENLLLTPQGTVKVTDFGIAKALERTVTAHGTSPGMLIGTVEYMAPEQARGEAVDARTDLYAVGVVAYELLTGRLPFPMPREGGPLQVLHQHVSVVPARPGTLAPGLDPRLDAWVMRLLAKDPAERPATAREARRELQDIMEDALGSRWRDAGEIPVTGPAATEVARPPLAVHAPPPPAQPPPPPPAPRASAAATVAGVPPRRRNPALMAGLGVGVVAVAVGGAVAGFLLSGRSGGDTAGRVTTPVTRSTTPTTPTTAPGTTTVPGTTTAPPPNDLLGARAATDRATRLLGRGDPIAAAQEQAPALRQLDGSGDTYEGNAFFNAGRAALALADCDAAAADLDRAVQAGGTGQQMVVRRRFRDQARRCVAGTYERTEPVFRSATGNLGCTAGPGLLACWRLEPTPTGFSLPTTDAPSTVAGGDTTGGPALGFQQFWGSSEFRCRLEEYGMSCRSLAGGRWGFFISRQRAVTLDPGGA